ncbi:MAG: DPP IV N-terminal domain-containing protein, partial [Rhodanobacter sp.]
MHKIVGKARVCGVLIFGLFSGGAMAQARTLTAADYARAESFMSYRTTPLVDHAVQQVHWLDDSHFWYRDRDAGGDRFMVMDTATGEAVPAFDQAALAAALGHARDKAVDAAEFPQDFSYSVNLDGRLEVKLGDKHYLCTLGNADVCAKEQDGREPGVLSPDRHSEAFIRDWNLWLRDVASGKETQLTTDGVENFGYATDNAGWLHSDRPVLNWSPDSKRIATYQQDQRKVGDMYLVDTRLGHSHLQQWKYPLAGDEHVFMIEPVVIDAASGKTVRLELPQQQRLSSLCDDISCHTPGHWDDLKWAPDSQTLALVSTSRDRKHEWFRVANANTGTVR